MKKFKTTADGDAYTVHIRGDKRNSEPGSLIVLFPGGNVEITRCTDDSYYVHVDVVDPSNIVDSRINYATADDDGNSVADLPRGNEVSHIAVRVAANKTREQEEVF